MKLGRISMTYMGYLGFLLTFAGLGLFVYGMAVASPVAWVPGVAAVASFALGAVGFRLGARQRAASNTGGIKLEGMDILTPPMTGEEVDRYLLTNRGTRRDGGRQPRRIGTGADAVETPDIPRGPEPQAA